MRNEFIFFSAIVLLGIGLCAWLMHPILWFLVILLPLLAIGFYDFFQKKDTIRRNYPIVGRFRKVAEMLRPKIRQYFIESDIDGRPFNRLDREIIYARANKGRDTTPFGTQKDIYQEGYEWMSHSIAAKDAHDLEHNPKVIIGNHQCSQPYAASLLNVSAMSFGSLSSRAVLALNGGAKIGDFAHNTGEGGLSPYHLKTQGDVIWQIGTGYFGCRTKDGNFDPQLFKENATKPSVKMIELKLSQGAKPGHGGILPAKKNTLEISKIRNVEQGTAVLSPPYHKAFNTPVGLLKFLQQMRQLSDGKPVGFKLCIGHKAEFISICKAMIKTEIYPDFISVDGGEGGTGAAPIEFSDSVGMPFRGAMAFVYDTLVGFDLKKHIKLNASGKIATGFDIYRAIALGADICSSARAMMLALGCIQALECNSNSCPTGIATQDKELVRGLVVSDKEQKVANYHGDTIESFIELLAAGGLERPEDITRKHLYRRVSVHESRRFDDFYPYTKQGDLLERPYPAEYQRYMDEAAALQF